MSKSSVILETASDLTALKAVRTQPWGDFWTIPWTSLRERKIFPEGSIDDDVWVIPPSWASAGQRRARASRTLKFAPALPPDWERSDPRSESVLRRLKRIAIASLLMPTYPVGAKSLGPRPPPQPSTWVTQMRTLVQLARDVLECCAPIEAPSSCPDPFPIFRHVPPEQLLGALEDKVLARKSIVPRLNSYLAHGLFDDWPAADVAGGSEPNGDPYRPFNDVFLTDLGRFAVWMTEEMGDRIIGNLSLFDDASKHKRKSRFDDWVKSQGRWTKLPYSFSVRINAYQVGTMRYWPPPAIISLRDLVGDLQTAHAVIVLLSLGLRISDLAELKRDCLVTLGEGAGARGAIHKYSQERDGRAREWPIPEIAAKAIRQQRQVADFLQPDSEFLFVTERGESDGVFGFRLQSLSNVELSGRGLLSTCEGNPHPHRFRKSVARIVALTLVGGAQILYEVFGHKDPEMTLSYMLSDPELQAEIREVAKEVSIALAVEAVKTVDGNGGPAAAGLREMVHRLAPRIAGQDMGTEDVQRAAKVLSRNGSQVMLVRRNVLCTKIANQAGPCTRKVGRPDVGQCQVACDHRLELEAAKADHATAIEQILEIAPSIRDELERAWWIAQLRTHLTPFPDLAQAYGNDARLLAVLGEEAPDV